MVWFDYVLLVLPAVLVSLAAQARISSAFARGRRVAPASGLSGAEVADLVLRAGGVTGVGIEPASGELSNHYDGGRRILRLSPGVYHGRSLTAMGVAAHEAGHALQDSAGYPGRFLRRLVVPVAELGSMVFWMLIAAGLLIGMFRLIVLAIVLLSTLVVLQVLNLPVELDASRRSRDLLHSAGLATVEEEPVVANVAGAAAWTYVAAALTGAFTMFIDPGKRRDAAGS